MISFWYLPATLKTAMRVYTFPYTKPFRRSFIDEDFMANLEHLEIIQQGTPFWNRWRKENSEIRADLSGADLSERDLESVNFENVNLKDAILWKSNCMNGNFRGADLTKAMLEGADLRYTDFTNASLERADLTEADRDGANFQGTIFTPKYKVKRESFLGNFFSDKIILIPALIMFFGIIFLALMLMYC